MKKGLLFTLAMAALVAALAVPVCAEAPLVPALSDIVIGGSGDTDGTNYLMRYNNAMNLLSDITWKNPTYPTSMFNAYLMDQGGGTSVTASDTAGFVSNLTVGQYGEIAGGLAPTGADSMMNDASSFYWMSLVDKQAIDAAASPAGNSYSATPAANGIPYGTALGNGQTFNAGYLTTNTCMLVATVTSGTGKVKSDDGAFDVICKAGAADQIRTNVTSTTFDTGWWQFLSYAPTYAAATKYNPTSDTIGFVVAGPSATLITYSEWLSKDSTGAAFILEHDGGGGFAQPLIKLAAVTETNVAASQCPGVLLKAVNAAYAHVAYILQSTNGTAGPSLPSAGNPAEAVIMVAPPVGFNQMGDGERVSVADWLVAPDPNAGKDGRDYQIQFAVAIYAGGQGAGTMWTSAVYSQCAEAPTAVTGDSESWDANMDTWLTNVGFAGPLFFGGTINQTADSIAMTANAAAAAGNWKLAMTSPPVADCTDFEQVTDGLVRVRAEIFSDALNTCPDINLYTKFMAPDATPPNPAFPYKDVTNVEYWNAIGSQAEGGARSVAPSATVTAPAAVPTTPTNYDTYIYTHTAANATDFVYPQYQLFAPGLFGWAGGNPATDRKSVV